MPSEDTKGRFLDLAPVAIITFCAFFLIISFSVFIIIIFEPTVPLSKYPKPSKT